jgi:outer membrane receptor protein involved in Fe transport
MFLSSRSSALPLFRLPIILRSLAGMLFVASLANSGWAQGQAADMEEDPMLEEVIVTTSATRLTSGFESPKPTTTIDAATIDARGSINIADIVNELPAFVGSTTPQSTTLNGGGTGANYLNLRNAGSNRVLVLVDRRRWVYSASTGGVDVNTIPQMLISQVEVVTGGASAQWGSDAVSGVVNFMLDRTLDGGKAEVRYGQSSHNDAKDKFGSFAYGFDFSDGRGHISIGAEYQDNNGILGQTERDWSAQSWGIVGNPLNTGPNDGIPDRIVTNNVLIGFGTPGGYLPLAVGNHPAVAQIMFGPGGTILPYDIGEYPIPQAFGALPFQIGGSGGSLGLPTSLLAPLERKAVTALFDYELTDNVSMFIDVSWAESETVNQIVQPWNFIGAGPDIIWADNPFIPAELQTIMADNGVPLLVMGRTNEDHGFITDTSTKKTKRIAVGLQGNVGNWSWDAYYTHGETRSRARGANNPITQKRLFSVDAVRDPGTGEIVCRANVGGANGAPGCVPVNLFGEGSPSQAALNYFMGESDIRSELTQDVVAASMNGEIFDLPAGPVAIAFGLEYRKEKAKTTYDDVAASGGFFILNGTNLSGDFDVQEAFVEVGVPVFQTDGGVSLDMTGAVRYADYSTVGSVIPWQLGATLGFNNQFTLRGTVSSDIRAPSIWELFTQGALSFNNITNPETGEITLAKISSGGNPDLTEESAKTITAGFVWQPNAARGLAISVDYFKTEIDDAITSLPSQTIVDNCYNLGVGCENVILVNGSIQGVNATQFNVAKATVEGIDFEAAYNIANVGGGDLTFRLLASHYMEVSFSPDGVTTFDDAGVVGLDSLGGVPTPKWRGNFSTDWVKGALGLTAQVVYVGGGELINDLTAEDINDNSVSSQTILNVGARYDFDMSGNLNLQLFAGVDNLFDQDPPIAPLDFVSNWSSNPFVYNVIGRVYYGGVRLNF